MTMTRQWIVENYLPTHGWSRVSRLINDEIVPEIENAFSDSDELFGLDVGLFGGAIAQYWRDVTDGEMPKFVDILVRKNSDDLRVALLIEVKYQISPENPKRALCKHAISKAIKQINSTREILKDFPGATDADYESMILIPEKYRSVNYAYFRDLKIQRQGFPKYTRVTSLKQLVQERNERVR